MTDVSNKQNEKKPNPTCAWCYGTGTRQPPPGPFMGGCAGPQPCGCSAPAVEPQQPTCSCGLQGEFCRECITEVSDSLKNSESA